MRAQEEIQGNNADEYLTLREIEKDEDEEEEPTLEKEGEHVGVRFFCCRRTCNIVLGTVIGIMCAKWVSQAMNERRDTHKN